MLLWCNHEFIANVSENNWLQCSEMKELSVLYTIPLVSLIIICTTHQIVTSVMTTYGNRWAISSVPCPIMLYLDYSVVAE